MRPPLRDLFLASQRAEIGSVGRLLVNHRHGRHQPDPVERHPEEFLLEVSRSDYGRIECAEGGTI